MTGKSLANPLQALIGGAAKTPVETGTTAAFRYRFERAGRTDLILCDTSSSMGDSAGTRRRIDHLRDALAQVATPEHVILAFSSAVQQLASAADLPAPSGGTALELALARAVELSPRVTLVISDGEPNQPEAALATAARLSGIIHCIYCGDESNREAVDFMRRLARAGSGRAHVHRWADEQRTPIAQTMRLLLAAPR